MEKGGYFYNYRNFEIFNWRSYVGYLLLQKDFIYLLLFLVKNCSHKPSSYWSRRIF